MDAYQHRKLREKERKRSAMRRKKLNEAMYSAVKQDRGFADLVKWVKNLTDWTDEHKEEVARRIIYRLLINNLISRSKWQLMQNCLNPSDYKLEIQYWREKTLAYNLCHIQDVNHVHNWSCGVCEECLGSGRTFLLFTTRSTGIKCVACNGTRIRSQEFEQHDLRHLMSDDLDGHFEDLLDFQVQPAKDFLLAHRNLIRDQELWEETLTSLRDLNFLQKESGEILALEEQEELGF